MPEQSKTPPSECLVCGNKNLLTLNRQTCEPIAHPVSGVLSYRCENGHVFLAATAVA